MPKPSAKYTAVIRTLGTAGEKFEREVRSLLRQSAAPKQILAYIPHGYDLPAPFEGSEAVRYIRCDKGMVTQRSQTFDEVDTSLIMFLDDDMELRPDTAEKLMQELEANNGDAIVVNVYPNHKLSPMRRLKAIFTDQTFPAYNTKWGFRLRRSANYNYASRPKPVMPAQSGAGACSMIKTDAFRQLDFAQERWIEQFGYAIGDDMLMFNKLYQGGWKLLVSYDTEVVHLDASSGHVRDPRKADFNKRLIKYVLWHRTQYSTAKGSIARYRAISAFYMSWLGFLAYDVLFAIAKRAPWKVSNRIKALAAAKHFVRSDEYKALKPFKIVREE